jgi:hypothetical protein
LLHPLMSSTTHKAAVIYRARDYSGIPRVRLLSFAEAA